jgi:RNA polymerase sigma factor (sigma-70 family)
MHPPQRGTTVRKNKLFKPLLALRDAGRDGLTLQRRLFAFFFLFLCAVMSGLLLILFSAGLFSTGLKESHIFLENELQHIAGAAEESLGAVAVAGVSLSGRLTEQLEKALAKEGLAPSELQSAPEQLEPLLDACIDTLSAALENNRVSAAFLVLDATVNPGLSGAESSRAGVFLKNMAPNPAYDSPSAIRYMRGPISLARTRELYVMPQWEMEFTVAPGDFFHTATSSVGSFDLPLSRLYYWNPKTTLPGDYMKAMLLAVPLVAEDGTVFGVCGFEISDMLFKMQYMPDNTRFARIFSVLAPIHSGNTLDASQALLAGSYTVTSAGIDGQLTLEAKKNGLTAFTGSGGAAYVGLYKPIRLYPKDAAHGDTLWTLGVLLPQQDLSDYVATLNRRVLLLLLSLFVFSAVAASLLSRRYISPVLNALGTIRQHTLSDYRKTNIQEIDDLLAFLAEQDQQNARTVPPPESRLETSALFNDFVQSIETLSPAERAVFNLYMEGYSAKEIAEMLCLSINTIKTHNKRIYMKLNVSSRNELLVYVRMMKEKSGVAVRP